MPPTVAEALRRALAAANRAGATAAAIYLTDADHDELNRPTRQGRVPVYRGKGLIFSFIVTDDGNHVML
jgi:hypothetical protein